MALQTLLEPLEINHMTLKNRIMFPPMTTGYEARDGSITEQSINFYKRVAEGGASYIVLGDVTPVHTISPTPKLVTDEQIPSFKALADALHEFGCKLGLQVFHPEYDTVAVAELFAKGDMAGARAKLHHDMQHYINEVTGERLQEILVHITALARRATQAGADAIEVHGDRLVGSLCSPLINQRTDEYGGSFENRTHFARAVVRAIREGSPDICIDYELPIITENPQLGRGGLFIDEAVELAKLLEADGVDTFHVGQANHTGNLNDTIPAMGTRPECFMAPYARRDAAEDRGGRRRPGRSGDRRVHRPRRLRGHHRRDDGADRRRGVEYRQAVHHGGLHGAQRGDQDQHQGRPHHRRRRGGHRDVESSRPGRTPRRPRADACGRRAGTADPGDQHPLRLRGHRLRHSTGGLRHRRA